MDISRSAVYTFLLMTVSCAWAQETADETVEGMLGYGEKTVEVNEVQDLREAVDSKKDITVLLNEHITVTDSAPCYDGQLNDSPCWDDSALFNLSNYVFKPKNEREMWNLSFAPAQGATAGKVVRNGRAEFYKLGNLNFCGIHNITSDMDSEYTPFQPVSADDSVTAAKDILASYGYGGVFSSASGVTKGESGGVYIHENEGAVSFKDICYNGSSMGDVNCDISLKGGAIYADPEWNVEINGNARSLGGDVSFDNVSIRLDRNARYANSSECDFYAFGGAIYTDDLSICGNYGSVSFNQVGIYQTAVHRDEGYGYGGALYLDGSSAISRNAGEVSFTDGGILVANKAQGGAVFLKAGAVLVLEENEGSVRFTGNTAEAAAIDGLMNDDAEAQGGAIYLGENSRLSISNNDGDVSFSCNEARASVSLEGAVATDAGGAIWGAAGSHIEISGNRSVKFIDNVASTGSAIHTQGTLSIRNNQYVLFEGNSGAYAVYLAGPDSLLQLSAAEGDTICFDDSFYVEGSAELNADYGEVTQQGTIEIFSATATVKRTSTLYNGTLLLKQGSKLDVPTLRLTSSAATLAAEGKANTITGNIDMAGESTLALTLNGYNTETAVLVLEGSLSPNGCYNLDISVNGVPAAGTEYILLELAQYGYAESAWNESNVHVTGDVAFENLEWQNDYTRLVYRVPAVPEPAAGVLCLAALSVLALRRRR